MWSATSIPLALGIRACAHFFVFCASDTSGRGLMLQGSDAAGTDVAGF